MLDNRFFSFDPSNWENTYQQMYTDMYNFLEPIGNDSIVVFSSHQVYGGAFPTPDMQNYFTNVIGCGDSLMQWAEDTTVKQTAGGMNIVVYYGVGIPNNGFGSGSGYYLSLYTPHFPIKSYKIMNVATLVLNSEGKTEILSAAQPEYA